MRKNTWSQSVSDTKECLQMVYSPSKILKIMTVNDSELLVIVKAMGVLQQGYDADIIATHLIP